MSKIKIAQAAIKQQRARNNEVSLNIQKKSRTWTWVVYEDEKDQVEILSGISE